MDAIPPIDSFHQGHNVKRLFMVTAIVGLLVSCQAQQAPEPSQPTAQQAPLATRSPVAPNAQQAGEQPKDQLLSPSDGAFQTPLPEGVVLSQPHYARMDVSVPGKSGVAGRRTEFEYLDGSPEQAMQAFAASMTAAGFTSDDDPSSHDGVVRQVFKKPGYGTVFARSEQRDASRNVHDSARGFVVVAWPRLSTNEKPTATVKR